MYKMNGCERLRSFHKKTWVAFFENSAGMMVGGVHARLYNLVWVDGVAVSSTCDRKLYVFWSVCVV